MLTGVKPMSQSVTVWAAWAMMGLSVVLAFFELGDLSPTLQQEGVSLVDQAAAIYDQAITFGLAVIAWWGRVRATSTLGKKG